MVHSQREINTRRSKKRFITSGAKESNLEHVQNKETHAQA